MALRHRVEPIFTDISAKGSGHSPREGLRFTRSSGGGRAIETEAQAAPLGECDGCGEDLFDGIPHDCPVLGTRVLATTEEDDSVNG